MLGMLLKYLESFINMKKIVLFVFSIMGVLSVQSCVDYRVRVIRHNDNSVFYIPSQRVGLMWNDSYFAYQSLSGANGEIKEWILKKQFINEMKHPKYINYDHK
jgi:hypothetical protein